MGDKIVKIENALISIGGYILAALKDKEVSLDILYKQFSKKYPKKIDFEQFVYGINFLFMIKKVKIKHDDVLEIVK